MRKSRGLLQFYNISMRYKYINYKFKLISEMNRDENLHRNIYNNSYLFIFTYSVLVPPLSIYLVKNKYYIHNPYVEFSRNRH